MPYVAPGKAKIYKNIAWVFADPKIAAKWHKDIGSLGWFYEPVYWSSACLKAIATHDTYSPILKATIYNFKK
jgi:hypothetical protein